jgi:phage tail-like protein
MSELLKYPLPVFRFDVKFFVATEGSGLIGKERLLCGGAFSEVSGLEATMEAKAIKAGGHNYGDFQRAGRVNFSTVVLKRGVMLNRDMWKWFSSVGTGGYAVRFDVKVTLNDFKGKNEKTAVMHWRMKNALPTKFRAADFNATSNQVGIEELHFVHEELSAEIAK